VGGRECKTSWRRSLLWLSVSAALAVSPCRAKAQNDQQEASSQAPAIRDAFITTSDHVRIHIREAGQLTAEAPIVFIPGWRLTASLWDQELRAFSQGRLTIAVDSRSQGESSVAFSGNTPERRAVDLRELTQQLHISRFVLVGWSQGVQDVAAYIQRFGTESLAGIALVDSPVFAGPAEIEAHQEFSKAALSRLEIYDENPEEYSRVMIRGLFAKPHPELNMQHIIDESMKTPTSIGIAMLVADFFGADRRPALAKIDRPVLVIASAQSPQIAQQKETAEAIHGARWVAVEDAAHALFLDQPKRFEDELRWLLQQASR
jgi:non-heme chloroperoxidase